MPKGVNLTDIQHAAGVHLLGIKYDVLAKGLCLFICLCLGPTMGQVAANDLWSPCNRAKNCLLFVSQTPAHDTKSRKHHRSHGLHPKPPRHRQLTATSSLGKASLFKVASMQLSSFSSDKHCLGRSWSVCKFLHQTSGYRRDIKHHEALDSGV